MPAPAQAPNVVTPKKRAHVKHTSVQQAAFDKPAAALAEKLGWAGPAHFVTNEITVRDAQRFIAKTMHEHHQAAAQGLPQPDYAAACEHLAVDNADEMAAIDAALKAAFESGKEFAVVETPTKKASLDVEMELSAGAGLAKLEEAEAKARAKR